MNGQVHSSWSKDHSKQENSKTESNPLEIHLRSSVLASLVRYPTSSRTTLCEGLLFGTRINRREVLGSTDNSVGGSLGKYKPIISICRAQCTGTSQSFYNAEGDVDPECLRARESTTGMDVIGWFTHRQCNDTFNVSTRQIIVTRKLQNILRAQPIVIVMSSNKLMDSKGLSFKYQCLDHNLNVILGDAVKLQCAERQTTQNQRSSMSLGDTSQLQLPSISNATTELEAFGSHTLDLINKRTNEYCMEEKYLADALATLKILRKCADKA